MVPSAHLRFIATVAFAVALASCSAGPSAPPPTAPGPSQAGTIAPSTQPTSPLAQAPGLIRGHVALGEASVWLECLGTGSPTVIMETGLGSGSGNWIDPQRALSETTRACRYDRVAIGQSGGSGIETIAAGARADELHDLLQVAQVDGPYVLVGWSFGGMIVRLFAARHPAETAGLVLLDSSHEDQFSDPWWTSEMHTWSDGPFRIIDPERSRTELLASTNLGAMPAIVLTQGQLNGDFERHWAPLQDALATMSTSSLHLVATKAGHDINDDAPELTLQAIEAVIAAARTGGALPACAGTFDVAGATCLDGTLVERLAAWDAIRAGVKSHAGAFPAGTYRMDLTGEQLSAATGDPQEFRLAVHTWAIANGHWKVSIRVDSILPPEAHEGVYDADGQAITFLLPDDWRTPGTPGVTELTWAVDSSGAITFHQTDAYPIEGSFLAPWMPSPADGG